MTWFRTYKGKPDIARQKTTLTSAIWLIAVMIYPVSIQDAAAGPKGDVYRALEKDVRQDFGAGESPLRVARNDKKPGADAPGSAGVIQGVPGAPDATITIKGDQLPPPPFKFGGKIEKNAAQSTPYWPPRIEPPKGAPNVLLIMTDDSGFGVPSTFGGVVPTPALDRIAQNGLRYTNFNSTALCSPTRAALITGRNHPFRWFWRNL